MYPDNHPLLEWIKLIRRQYHKWTRGESTSLTDERRQILEDIGFDFNPRRHYAPPKTGRYKNFKTMRLQEDAGVYVDVATGTSASNTNNSGGGYSGNGDATYYSNEYNQVPYGTTGMRL